MLAVADFLTGVGASVRAGSFQVEWVAVWLQGHLAGRVFPVTATALLGQYFSEPLFAIAGLALASYTAETLVSIRRNLTLPEATG